MEIAKAGQKQAKKPTNAQLQRRIDNAVIHVDKTKDTKSIFFSDKGLRITVTGEYAIIETSSHRHVFDFITGSGNVSRPYIYTNRFIDMAFANDCSSVSEDGIKFYSYGKLMKVLREKEDKTEYNIAWFVDLWMFNLYSPLFEIDETTAGAFLVYERYIHNIARNRFLLEEHKEDVTNLQFFNNVIELEKSFIQGITEEVILKGKSDEERLSEEMEALQRDAEEKVMEEQVNNAESTEQKR